MIYLTDLDIDKIILDSEKKVKLIKAKIAHEIELSNVLLENIGLDPDNCDIRAINSMRLFVNKISAEKLIEFGNIASAKLSNKSDYAKFKYFCGICHNHIASLNEFDELIGDF